MAARPAKRQRRSTVLVSDDEDDTAESTASSQHTDTTTNRGKKSIALSRSLQTRNTSSSSFSQPASNKPSPQSSPSKSRKNGKPGFDAKNKSLHNFFNRATEEQRWQRKEETGQLESQDDTIIDDIVDDDIPDNELAQQTRVYTPQQSAGSASKSVLNSKLNGLKPSTLTSSQKFARTTTASHTPEPANLTKEPDTVSEYRPWADRFGPSTVDELAIHKKKLADVQRWLEDVSTGKSPQKMLVLKGPAGSGKSTAISLIARNLGFETVPWRNPVVSGTGNASSIQQFAEFLNRGGQFQALSLDGVDIIEASSASDRTLLIIEEFPTTMTQSSNVLDTFRSLLLQHVVRSIRSFHFGASESQRPVVLIISETLLTSSTALSDSFTAHRLLGPELLNHPLTAVIEFNPVASTFISKALDLVIKKEARESQRRRMPGAAVLQQLADVGDIRSAINSLEFLCTRGDDAANWSGTVAARSKKASKTGVPLTEGEKNALQLISLRESTLDMFHATGKIVYNKREDPRALDSRAEPPPKPPDHLMHLYTHKVTQVDVDALLNETGTDIQTFISTLHENYVLSCNGDDFVDSFADCSAFISDSDYLNPETRSLIRAKGGSRMHFNNTQSGNFEMLRQDEISFQVASRGLLFALPFPVSRATPPGLRKQDAFKMFYPTSLRLWKPAEEIYDLVSMYTKGIADEDIALSMYSRGATGVASWKTRSHAFGPSTSITLDHIDTDRHPVSCTSREQLVTEILPFLTSIRIAQTKDVQILQKITHLQGINMPVDDMFDDERDHEPTVSTPGSVRLQQRVEEAHALLRAQKLQLARDTSAVSQAPAHVNPAKDLPAQEKLYISDDDIQDD